MAVTPHQEEEVLDALDRLRLAGLLIETEEDSYRFTHDLIREVVETDLGARRRRILHRRMALALERYAAHERTSQAADLAYHFSEAGDIGEALPYALMAGDQAEAAFAHTEASAHFHAAIRYAEATGDLPRKAEALEKLGATLLCFGQTDPALVAPDEATKLYDELDDDEGRYRSLALIVETHWQRGTAQEFLKHLGPNLGAEQRQESASPSPGLAALYKSICGAHRYDGQYEELANAARHLERLAHELHDDSLLLTARYHQAYVACSLSTEAPIPTAFLDLVPLAERIGDSVTLLTLQNDISAEYLFSGQFSLADTYIKRAVQQAQQFGSPHHITKMLINRAELHYCRGAWADARADSLQVEAIAKESDQFGITYSLLYRLILRGMLAMAEGCEEVARELLTHVRQLSNGNHDLHALAYSSHLLAESDLLAGRAAETCVYLMPVLDELHDIPEFANYVYPFAAWALLGSGRKQEAFSVVESGIASMRARNRNLFLTQALRVRAMVAIQSNRCAAAKADLDEAIMLAEAMPYPYAALKALWVYGQLEAARGDLVAARTRYDEALAICDRLGEGLYRKHIERDLATLR